MRKHTDRSNSKWTSGACYRFWRESEVMRMRMSRKNNPVWNEVQVPKGWEVAVLFDDGPDVYLREPAGESEQICLGKTQLLRRARPVIRNLQYETWKDYLALMPGERRVIEARWDGIIPGDQRIPEVIDGVFFFPPGLIDFRCEDQPFTTGKSHCCVKELRNELEWTGDGLYDFEIDFEFPKNCQGKQVLTVH
ncbi:MAG: hypothetical protein ABIK09_12475 [Pseudomonadota bacterium]